MGYDYTGKCRELFGEAYEPPFAAPAVPGISEIKRAVAEVAFEPRTMRPIFQLWWLPDYVVRRAGRQVRANVVFTDRVPFAEFYDDDRKLVQNRFEDIEIPMCRWGVYQLLPDEVARPEWERERREYSETQGIDWLGEFPEGGLYRPTPHYGMLAEHDIDRRTGNYTCCVTAMFNQENCYGRLRNPGPWLVRELRQKWAEFLRAPHYRRPHEAPTAHEVRTAARHIEDQQTASRERMGRERAEEMRDMLAPLRARLEGRVSVDIGAAALAAGRNKERHP